MLENNIDIEKIAFNLIQQYIDGWKQNNLTIITSCLAENCIIIESHGPVYRGISDIVCWFKFWFAANSKITKWNILSFYFCNEKKTAFVEWDFSCISNNIEYLIQAGISVVRFVEQKIAFIHEYRMIHPEYMWEKDKLKSR